MGKKGKQKEVGKVIVKKKARKVPSVKIRWDYVFAAILIVLIGGAIGYFAYVTYFKEPTTPQAENPVDVLYKGVEEVFINKNKNATLDLYYKLRGEMKLGNVTLSVKDFVQHRVFFYDTTVTPNASETGNETQEPVVLSGFGAIPFGAYYIDPLLNLTGFYSKPENISDLLINVKHLREDRNISVSVTKVGEEDVYLKTFDSTFHTVVYRYVYDVPQSNTTTAHVVGEVWYETKYGVPVKAVFNIDGLVMSWELQAADLNYLGQGAT